MHESLPPGPRLPSALQIVEWAFRPIPFIEGCARRFGETFTIRFPNYPPIVLVSDPETIREVFGGDPDQLYSGSPNRMLTPLLGVNSLILLDGTPHRKRRKLLMPPFHGERMRAYGSIMREVADAEIGRWETGRAFPVHPRMQRITFDVILRTVIGIGDSQRLERFRSALLRLMGFTANPGTLLMVTRTGEIRGAALQERLGPFSPWGRFLRLRAAVDELLFDEFARRRTEHDTEREDILSLLLDARDEAGGAMSDRELRDEMMTLLVAGHETTATALSWVLYRVLRDREVLDAVVGELRAVAGSGPVESEQVPRLEYLDAVIKETARLHPVLPFVVRELQSPMTLGKLTLPAGVIVAPNILLTHRRADLWPEPERFDPRRFVGKKYRGDRFFPFGGGVRTCVGMAFASFEMKIVLAQTLLSKRLRLKPGYRARVVRRSITFAPSAGMPVIVEERATPGFPGG